VRAYVLKRKKGSEWRPFFRFFISPSDWPTFIDTNATAIFQRRQHGKITLLKNAISGRQGVKKRPPEGGQFDREEVTI
jgi:hypothetical protein